MARPALIAPVRFTIVQAVLVATIDCECKNDMPTANAQYGVDDLFAYDIGDQTIEVLLHQDK